MDEHKFVLDPTDKVGESRPTVGYMHGTICAVLFSNTILGSEGYEVVCPSSHG